MDGAGAGWLVMCVVVKQRRVAERERERRVGVGVRDKAKREGRSLALV